MKKFIDSDAVNGYIDSLIEQGTKSYDDLDFRQQDKIKEAIINIFIKDTTNKLFKERINERDAENNNNMHSYEQGYNDCSLMDFF